MICLAVPCRVLWRPLLCRASPCATLPFSALQCTALCHPGGPLLDLLSAPSCAAAMLLTLLQTTSAERVPMDRTALPTTHTLPCINRPNHTSNPPRVPPPPPLRHLRLHLPSLGRSTRPSHSPRQRASTSRSRPSSTQAPPTPSQSYLPSAARSWARSTASGSA